MKIFVFKTLIFALLAVQFLSLQVAAATEPLRIKEWGSGNNSKHFVLVHGTGHGAWCWFKLIPLLRNSGHNVTALDLAASGIDLSPVWEVSHFADYIRPLTDFMASLPEGESVILVAHSFGGLAVCHAMEKFPEKVSAAVFVAAAMLGPRANYFTLLSDKKGPFDDPFNIMDSKVTPDPPTITFTPKFMKEKMYQLSPIEDWTLATLLVRPLYWYSVPDVLGELILTPENYGSIPRIFITAGGDNFLSEAFRDWMLKHSPPDELDEIQGADHMVMISKPKELSKILLTVATKYS